MTKATSALWHLVKGNGPLCAVAIHDGHELRAEVEALMSLSESCRFREEDPFTGAWTAMAPTRMIARRSRFEVDLNRPRDRAVYINPEDAWGLKVWKSTPSPGLVENSLTQYDAFYDEARRVFDEKVEKHGRFVVFDLHTYNHRRSGPGARYDAQSQHPDVNLGTGTMHRERWAPLIERLRRELEACDYLGRRLDCRENIKFLGGNFSRWVHETYPETGCSLAIEFKKFFMDEWSGQLDEDLHRGILDLLITVAEAVSEELKSMAPPSDAVDYGNMIRGLWRCPGCGGETLPRQLMQQARQPEFKCTTCGVPLTYGETG